MNTSDIWTLVGLCLGTIGALLLAYDVVYGAGHRFRASNFKTQLEMLRGTRKFSRDAIKGLPESLYTAEEIKRQLDEEEREWGSKEADLVQKVNNFYNQYEDHVVTLGALGVMLIVSGFVLQIVGLIVHTTGK